MKRRIRLSESDLHKVIKESVKRVLKEGRSGTWNQYRLKDFAHDVFQGIIWRPGLIKNILGEEYPYRMKGRLLVVTFPDEESAEMFMEEDAPTYPDYQFSIDEFEPSRIKVRCTYDEQWGF